MVPCVLNSNVLSSSLLDVAGRSCIQSAIEESSDALFQPTSEGALDDLWDFNVHAKHVLHKQVNHRFLVSLEISLNVVHVSLLAVGVVSTFLVDSLLQLLTELIPEKIDGNTTKLSLGYLTLWSSVWYSASLAIL